MNAGEACRDPGLPPPGDHHEVAARVAAILSVAALTKAAARLGDSRQG